MEFKVFQKEIELQSRGWIPTFHDVTSDILHIVEESGIKNGTVCIASHHTTCSVMVQECSHDIDKYDLEYLQHDILKIMQKYRIIILELLEEYEKRLHRFVDYFYDDEDQYKIFPVHRELLINEEPSEKELELLNQLYALLPEATDEELKLISEDINTYYSSWYNLTPLLQERLKRGDKEAEEKQAYLLEWNSITDDTWDGVDDGSDETQEEI